MNETLIRACEQADYPKLEELGWQPVLDALNWSVAKGARELHATGLTAYADLLGDLEPGLLVNVIREITTETPYRPKPATIRARIGPAAGEPKQGRHERPSPLMRTNVLEHVAEAFQNGLRECERNEPCPRSALIGWHKNRDGVLTCQTCGGLEAGQVMGAEDAGLL